MVLTSEEKEYLDGLYNENIALLKELGRIPAPPRHEERRAEYVENWLKGLILNTEINSTLSENCETLFDAVRTDQMHNVIAEIGCKENCPVLIFAAHTDVVFDITDELPMREDKGRLYAPGIGDDTANLVNLLMTLKCAAKFRWGRNTGCGLVFAADSCEEGLGNLDGARELMKHYGDRVRCFVSFDTHIGKVCSGAVGSHRYKISVRTDGGHSYFDFGAPNAIEHAAELICELYAQDLPEETRTTVNVGTVHGGTSVNSIAQSAEFTYEYRSESEKCLQTMADNLKKMLQEKQDDGWDICCETLGIRPGSEFVDAAASRQLNRLTEQNVRIVAEYNIGVTDRNAFSTDSNIPLSMGIPANTIGTAVGDGMHTMEEWIEMEGQKKGMRIAAEVVKAVIGLFAQK